MAITKPSIPKGTRDFGPKEMARRNFIFDSIKEVYKKYGYQQLETPCFENLNVLMGKYGEEGDKLLFKILNSGDFLNGKPTVTDQDIAAGANAVLPKISKKGLRYDLTVPFARYVAMNRGTLSFPFRRFQIQPVWRADRPQKGRYQEFFQCDADVIGTDSLLCEAEILGMLTEAFAKLGITDYTIKINNRKILTGISEFVDAAGREGDLCVAIDKLDKIGLEKVQEELQEKGFNQKALDFVAEMVGLEGTDKYQLLEDLATKLPVEIAAKGLEELKSTFDFAKSLNVDLDKVEFDVTLARGLSYYTGAIFEVKVNNVQMGSISGGGRYDDLTGVFGFAGMSGVGISFGIDRIYDVMTELELFPEAAEDNLDVLFINFDEESQAYCLPLLAAARQQGLKSELYPESAKMKKQMTYANNRAATYVVLAGSNEISEGKVTIKEMESGNQEQVVFADWLKTQ